MIFRFADSFVCYYSGIKIILGYLFGIRKTSFIYRFRNMKYLFLKNLYSTFQTFETGITYRITL